MDMELPPHFDPLTATRAMVDLVVAGKAEAADNERRCRLENVRHQLRVRLKTTPDRFVAAAPPDELDLFLDDLRETIAEWSAVRVADDIDRTTPLFLAAVRDEIESRLNLVAGPTA